jgi:hypothetical protein
LATLTTAAEKKRRKAARRAAARRAADRRAAQRASRYAGDGTPTPFDLDRMLTLAEVVELVGVSRDSIQRHYAHLIRRITPGRVGIRMRDALTIGEGGSITAA